jgi:hypothetical protein
VAGPLNQRRHEFGAERRLALDYVYVGEALHRGDGKLAGLHRDHEDLLGRGHRLRREPTLSYHGGLLLHSLPLVWFRWSGNGRNASRYGG